MPRLVVATHNAKKGGEMVAILSAGLPGWEILTLQDFPGAPEPEEVGLTYAQNAAIKAESAHAFTGEICIADDAGLEIDALDGAPGLYSKRFGGENLPFEKKIQMILNALEGVPEEKRGARFVCSIAIAAENLPFDQEAHGQALETMGSGPAAPDFGARIARVFGSRIITDTCEGRIAKERSGMNGFGYDPIFFLPELGRCMADLSPQEKNRISHRGKVLSKAIPFLKELASEAL